MLVNSKIEQDSDSMMRNNKFDIDQYRPNKYGSHDIFRNRWSPRAMSDIPVDENDLLAMFEAAHWAPSSYNNQPWRFLYAKKGTQEWDTYFNLLAEANQVWCKNVSILMVIISKTTFDHNGKPMNTHAFDTGAAWGMLALEGARRGLVVHGMAGFDYKKAKEDLNIPDGFEVRAMAAIGNQGDPETLPEKMRLVEKPSSRKDLTRLVSQGTFNSALR
ncbi:MAG: nitroreductase family protein [candidate division Zixibacteria bacterium]